MKKKIILCLVLIILAGAVGAGLLYNGIIQCNHPSKEKYKVRGVDVSSYQGEIEWDVLANENIQFAFIKATEGSSYVDPNFQKNYTGAVKTALRIGAYHFFSFDSSGKTQADNFISNVPKSDTMLPPVVDVEFYGDKEKNIPEKEAVQSELTIFLEELEVYYGVKPIIYATKESYDLYIKECYGEYALWIRSVYCKPERLGVKDWDFWQYSNRVKLNGYHGEEKFIDMNVFSGSKDEFETYGIR